MNLEGNKKGVGIASSTEEIGEHHVTREAKHPRQGGHGTDNSGGFQ